MFSPRTSLQRTTILVVSVATATALALAGSATASAHPGVFDSETCAESLTRVWSWPGSISEEPGGHLIFSDAYESYLLRQPPCNGEPTGAVTPRYNEDHIGHQHPQ
ncbi:hypothetical protein E4P40_05850 [Blastococcus sp. CT_GayMR20]|uniref:hypothetical protein n=1 Tax=Blastococcus sp. CT_GayMR20 TaxID=2559609 RepID=UPI001074755E|nr:hypothetical protein [Blastococcus sp. CT_GayMR20]TFV91550.1 hypothetical protein E4P40_05850 [Blastococcus sp. CT_GayMR20]